MRHVEGNLQVTIVWLLLVWLTAGFGEEIILRGYFMRQFVKFFGDNKMSLAINILIFSSFFGYMHMQQGITGQLVAASTGALLSIIFYMRKCDLWFMIMVHGFFNTLGILGFYFELVYPSRASGYAPSSASGSCCNPRAEVLEARNLES